MFLVPGCNVERYRDILGLGCIVRHRLSFDCLLGCLIESPHQCRGRVSR